ncbi:MAG: uncharacterized protein QOJ19_3000 [Acidimicrobiia bacterium]|nr:uncharacterized protein [Acidimicrobiia bacterium]
MFVLALVIEMHLPACRSLKDRRAVVRPVLDGARHRFRVSCADVGYQDKWQRARLGFAVVASSEQQAFEIIDAVERFVWSFTELEVSSAERRWLDVD